jgi:ribose 5-phosphate isomerase A
MDPEREARKRQAAERALELVQPDMTLGIGTGSTVRYFIEGLGRRVAEQGLRVAGVTTSERSARLAREVGVTLLPEGRQGLDLAVDGADEIAPDLGLIKGGGGALLREKLVASAAARFVVIADDAKLVPALGRGPLPIEVVPFRWEDTARRVERLDLRWELRGGEASPYVTDNGNLVLDVRRPSGFGDPDGLAAALKAVLGVVEHGLFLHLARSCLVGAEDGVRTLGEALPTTAQP